MSEVLLGELLSSKGITYGVVKPGDYETNGIPLIKAADVENGRVNTTPNFRISREKHQEHSRTELNGGELLITLVGTPGQCAVAPPQVKGFNVVRAVGVFSVNALADSRFIMYSIQAPQSQAYIRNVCNTTVQATLNLGDFKGLPLSIPEINEQKAIAHILGTLDDKIELNRKTNETLEAMAKALFKSWFVNFDPVRAKAEGRPTGLPAEISDLFPDSFEDSELGEIPSGWRCCSFTELIDVISGGTPKTSIDDYWNGVIPWFSVVDAPTDSDCWVIRTEKSITPLGLDNCSSKLLPTGTTIISARGTVGKVCLTGQNMAMNQSCYGLRAKGESGDYFCFYLTKSLVEILEARAHGSVFSTITRGTLDGVTTISPGLEVIHVFNGIARSLLERIRGNLVESQILSSQRDALLPKLISGEIRIPDAERMLEEAGI